MSKTYSIGPDELADYEISKVDADILIYYYEQAVSYGGDGYAIAVKDGRVDMFGLGHCSCYGPTDDLVMIYPWSLDEAKNFVKYDENYPTRLRDVSDCDFKIKVALFKELNKRVKNRKK